MLYQDHVMMSTLEAYDNDKHIYHRTPHNVDTSQIPCSTIFDKEIIDGQH